MKRVASPVLSRSGESALRQYEQVLGEQEDLTPASVRNYLSDVRQFMAWYEAQAGQSVADRDVPAQHANHSLEQLLPRLSVDIATKRLIVK
jgi:hypothetical protein